LAAGRPRRSRVPQHRGQATGAAADRAAGAQTLRVVIDDPSPICVNATPLNNLGLFLLDAYRFEDDRSSAKS